MVSVCRGVSTPPRFGLVRVYTPPFRSRSNIESYTVLVPVGVADWQDSRMIHDSDLYDS